ncbi:MAG TPA: lysophospholipid acyltransferase family protein [Candidatus Omnitrophota bacterium]|nr:lysophospholipid acyltransferase family protein [Candidatus Omnitrophota bacterium]HRY85235.1 lysophospholipid acyltransferase family protein [Candidatus Omnitrophota bacterium]
MAKRKFYRYPLYLLTRLGAGLLLILPRRWALALANGAGRLGYRLVSRQRTRILENLKLAYKDTKSPWELEVIGRQVMGHMLCTAVDFLRFATLSRDKAASFIEAGSAYSVCKDILQEGNGLIIMTAHMGNWELLAGSFGLQGFRGAVVGRRIYYEPYNRWITGLRRSVGVETIYQDQAVRQIHHHLRAGEIVGLLPDQDMDRVRGIFVDFFGEPAYTSVAPVKFAMASKAPILPAFMIRMPDHRYRLLLGDLIRPKIEGGDREASIRKYTEAWMKVFEGMIRRYPEQWGWMHDRWRTTPEEIAAEAKETVKRS